jgi:small subunit ribosomal protein S5
MMMAAGRRGRRPRRPEEREPFNIEAWQPKTELGRKVKSRDITSVDEIFEMGKPILEHEIVDALVPNIKDEVLQINQTTRMTDSGRKFAYRAVVLVGDENGHVGIGSGKAAEAKPAVESAIKYAKRNIIKAPLGCGSWECGCGTRHSLPLAVLGRNGSVYVTIKPAPRGLGIAAGEVVKKVLRMAGVHDAWTFSKGRTRNVYNTAMATLDALDGMNRMKFKGDWETRLAETAGKAEAKGETNA